MTPYQRIFGAGPRGFAVSLATLGLAWALDAWLVPPPLHGSRAFGIAALAVGVMATAAIVAWAVSSLPPEARGRTLVTDGPFRYVRHPIYAAFLGGFDFGLALYLDGWIYVAWAVAQYPIWHVNVAAEERLMRDAFGEDYGDYCRVTGRFWPRLSSVRSRRR